MKYILFTLIVILTMAVSSCGQDEADATLTDTVDTETTADVTTTETTADTNDNIQSESDVQPIISPNGEHILSINDDLYLTSTDIYVSHSKGADVNIKASYPVLHMTDVSASELINQQIRDYIDENYSYYYTDTQLVANDTLSSNMLYEITLFDENTLSIHFYGSFCGFGIPAYVEDHAFTFDLKNGNQIAISALYSDEQIEQFISTYFDEFDESAYPILMNSYDKGTIRSDFIKKFNSENDDSSAFYNSYYISYDKLYLIAGWYPDYASDINAPVSGSRAFIAEVETQTTADIKAIIDENLDILASVKYSTKSEKELIAAHPDAFEAIVALGKRAIPFLGKYTDTDREMTSEEADLCVIARAAAYAIDPSLYDLVFESPDGKARLKFTVRTLNGNNWLHPDEGMTYDISLITSGVDEPLSDKCFEKSEISWNDNSSYALLCCKQKSRRFPAVGLLVDIVGGKLIELPSFEVYNRLIKEEPDIAPFFAFSASKCEFMSDRRIKVDFELSTGASFYPRKISGHYIWDMDRRVMTDCAFASDETGQAEALLTDEEIFEIVDKDLNTIVSSGEVLFDSQLFSIYPDEVAEIVSFGKSALGALESIIEHDTTYYTNTEASIPKGLIAQIIAYIIDPSLYDLNFESPDSSIRLRFGVESFTCMLYRQSMTTSYDQIDIISSEDNSLISAFDTDPNYGSYTDISVSWSEDGAYAAVSFCNDVYDGYTVIINISEHEVIALPSIRESILPTAGIVIPYVAAPFTLSYSLDEWLDDGWVRIKYYYKSPENLSSAYEGNYLFDIESRTFSDVKVELLSYGNDSSDIPETTGPDAAGIKAIIEENLDILASDPYSRKSEKEIIDEHPEAFEKIVALGNAALPYLKEIGKEYKYVGEDTSGNLRCFMAMAAAYAIDPDAYDRVYPSPDGQFAIKATVSSFERLADPFAGIKYNLTLIKTETGEALATSGTAYCFSEIQWSPDSKYASFADSYRHLYTYLHIFDTGNSIFYALPNERELEDFLGIKLESTDENGYSYVNLHCYIEEWENDSVKVQIVLEGPAGGEKIVGWYSYDLAARKIESAQIIL